MSDEAKEGLIIFAISTAAIARCDLMQICTRFPMLSAASCLEWRGLPHKQPLTFDGIASACSIRAKDRRRPKRLSPVEGGYMPPYPVGAAGGALGCCSTTTCCPTRWRTGCIGSSARMRKSALAGRRRVRRRPIPHPVKHLPNWQVYW